jgi:hypothetical protein
MAAAGPVVVMAAEVLAVTGLQLAQSVSFGPAQHVNSHQLVQVISNA